MIKKKILLYFYDILNQQELTSGCCSGKYMEVRNASFLTKLLECSSIFRPSSFFHVNERK